ncbi:MAG: hypothetical protein QOI53_609, partial [Verrucomicrobiota bacterium]|jgi:hypothetical protein|nr:hypothetical protein [Verrucomicrobiota bacterium]
MSRSAEASAPGPEMVNAVAEMLRNLEQISVDPAVIGQCPELPGVVLDKVFASCLDREGPEYAKITRDYSALRAHYFKALAADPVGRALAALAVGSTGVELMELGRPPAFVSEARPKRGRPLRGRRDTYNCHHVVPKSIRPASDGVSINHPTNFVVAKTTRRGLDQSGNPHHFWHSLFLHPQTHNAPAETIPIYVVRPLFPFYPPITQGFRSAEEIRQKLASMGAPQLPEVWENRILEFSKATKHQPYAVPKEFHEITRMFGDLFKAQNKDPAISKQIRSSLAEQGARLAADFLPAGAYVNGKQLPADHKPKKSLPVIETQNKPETVVRPPPARRKSCAAKRQLPRPVLQTPTNHLKV